MRTSGLNVCLSLRWGFSFLALAVLIGAFGAHAFKDVLVGPPSEWWKTANFYHFIHALGLVVFSLISCLLPKDKDAETNLKNDKILAAINALLIIGIFLFSGSLYAMALTHIKVLGAITPIGGVMFIVAWLLAATKVPGIFKKMI